MLVPEADDVSQFVNDDSKLIAIVAYGYGLRTIASFADERTASARTHLLKETTKSREINTPPEIFPPPMVPYAHYGPRSSTVKIM